MAETNNVSINYVDEKTLAYFWKRVKEHADSSPLLPRSAIRFVNGPSLQLVSGENVTDRVVNLLKDEG